MRLTGLVLTDKQPREIPNKQCEDDVPHSALQLLVSLLQIYSFIVLARVVMSWIPNLSPTNQIVQVLYGLTEPVLEPVRRIIPPLGMMDISPVVVFVALRILQGVLLRAAAGM